MNNADSPAMGGMIPRSEQVIQQEEALYKVKAERYTYQKGLTKREHFAGLAMKNILSHYNPYEDGNFDSSNYDETVKHAVGLADALLKELSK